MFDIKFYMKFHDTKYGLMNGEKFDEKYIFDMFENIRSKAPVIYNIETTNACNMNCEMCPRTTMMSRKIEMMNCKIFDRILDQIRPFPDQEWEEWEKFVEKNYHISKKDISENHFFLYVIPKVIVLHGYGDPLLDKHLPQRIAKLTQREIPSYFSCNPANIDIEKNLEIFKNGLDYIKYSVESVDDMRHKSVRGTASNFTESYRKIMKLFELKEQYNLSTTIVITMLNLKKQWQGEEFDRLKELFKDVDAYVYLKSQDQHWYQDKIPETKSIHWIEFCQFPWSSMTIKSNGAAVQCVEDFNNEIVLGDAKIESLYDIWNGEKYQKLRLDHFKLSQGIKCTQQCDMELIGDMTHTHGPKNCFFV